MQTLLTLVLVMLAAGCTNPDYALGGKGHHDGDDSGTGFDADADSGDYDSAADDTAAVPVGDGDCYDPGTAYDMQPAAGLVVTQSNIGFDLAFMGSSAGYTSELWLWAPEQVWVGTGHETDAGNTVSVGTYAEGTELMFAIVVTDTGDTFYSGPSTRNVDGFDHAAITYAGDCRWVVGFEDQLGGGDQDFNDIQLTIAGPLELQLVE